LGAQELAFDFPPNYQFPVLSDSDFQVFLVVGENPGNVPRSYLDQNNVTEERLAGLLAKILANSAIKRGADPASIVKLYGDSVIFNPSEDALYEKYKDRINKVMEMLERLE
jgi:hypothetical protein